MRRFALKQNWYRKLSKQSIYVLKRHGKLKYYTNKWN